MEDNQLASVLVDIRHNDWPLIISFAGLGDQFQFKNILSALDVNIIYLRDLRHNWYLNGVPGVGNNVEEITVFLSEQINQHSFRKIITVGASAGGFAALLFGSQIGADVIMAFSPQTFMDRFRRLLYWDRRWEDRRKEIYTGNASNRSYVDLKPVMKTFEGEVQLFYDKNHRLDKIHAKRLILKHVTRFNFDEGGHTLVKYLKDSGKLVSYIKHAIK